LRVVVLLAGQLPKDYGCLEGNVLEKMMRMFDSKGRHEARRSEEEAHTRQDAIGVLVGTAQFIAVSELAHSSIDIN
jgi:hypothetical protein